MQTKLHSVFDKDPQNADMQRRSLHDDCHIVLKGYDRLLRHEMFLNKTRFFSQNGSLTSVT